MPVEPALHLTFNPASYSRLVHPFGYAMYRFGYFAFINLLATTTTFYMMFDKKTPYSSSLLECGAPRASPPETRRAGPWHQLVWPIRFANGGT